MNNDITVDKQVNLTTALKLKKRLQDKVAQAYQELRSAENIIQYPAAYPQEFGANIEKLLDEYSRLACNFAKVSQIIASATTRAGVTQLLAELDSVKSTLSYLNLINTRVQFKTEEDGTPYDSKIQIDAAKKKELIESYTNILYNLQDQIDTTNGKTVVILPDELLS